MATETWPVGFPQRFHTRGFRRRLKPTAVNTNPEVGPARSRRRTTQKIYVVSGVVIMSESQLFDFEDWFFDTINGGVDRFNWVDPLRSNVVVEMKYIAESPPAPNAAGPVDYAVPLLLEMYV